MAPYVSRFLTRLFQVESDLDAIRRNTSAQDDLFRFKIDFVRRRALPLLKGGAHVVSNAGGRSGRRPADRQRGATADLELAIARAGCALMDREKAGDTSDSLKSDVESLKRWCAARLHDRAYRPGSSSDFLKRSTTGISWTCSIPSPPFPKRCSAPTGACAAATASS